MLVFTLWSSVISGHPSPREEVECCLHKWKNPSLDQTECYTRWQPRSICLCCPPPETPSLVMQAPRWFSEASCEVLSVLPVTTPQPLRPWAATLSCRPLCCSMCSDSGGRCFFMTIYPRAHKEAGWAGYWEQAAKQLSSMISASVPAQIPALVINCSCKEKWALSSPGFSWSWRLSQQWVSKPNSAYSGYFPSTEPYKVSCPGLSHSTCFQNSLKS